MIFQPEKPPIFAETPETLADRLRTLGEKSFRSGQILDWIYKKRVFAPAQMKNLPESLRTWLDATFDFLPNESIRESVSSDVTRKHLQRLRDGALIETVLLQAPKDDADDAPVATDFPSASGSPPNRLRQTICISTQVGCAMACRFCASGLGGLERNLSTGEIVGQLLAALALSATPAQPAPLPDNIVVMGMGEPFTNYENLLAALRIFNAPWALGIGARRVTVSTCGIVPRILEFAREPLGTRLAISLHGATNAVRDQIMPVNKTWPLEKLLPACKTFAREHGQMLTLEFILIADLNDTPEQALALARIASELHAHVNLIPCNPVAGLPWQRPTPARQNRFAETLRRRGISATLRREKGTGIDAACGQLRRQHLT